jgi:tetratricopeptide (TPR) repeat protein
MFEEDDEDYFEGNLKEDLERFEAFLKGDSLPFLDSDRLEALIDHYLISNQYSKAKSCAEHALTLFAYNTLFHLRKAQSISAMGQLKEALHGLSQIEKWESPSCEFLLTKASIFSQLRDSKNAIKYFKDALALSEPEDRDEIYLDLAMEFENAMDYKNAVLVLKEAIKYNPNNEGAIYEIAFCYDQLGEYENAIQCYSDFIDENPYSFTAWYNLGNAFTKLERHEKAIWAYEYCQLINEDFGPVYFNMGSALISLEKFQDAIDCFNKCMELDGVDPMALCYIGEAYEQLNDLEKAKENYAKSVELAPLLPDAWLGLGIVSDLEGKTKEALVLLNKAAELDPDNAGIYHVLAGAHEKLGDKEEAEGYYLMALEMDPNDEECLSNYTEFIANESVMKSLVFLQAFMLKLHTNKIAPILEVNALWNLGRKQEALAKFEGCVANDLDKAKEIFDINPQLTNVKEFVHLTHD